jgi:hypothetical protein
LLGALALGGAAAAAVPTLLVGGTFVLPWIAVHAIGAYCMSRRSVTHQVLGQGVALTLAATHGGAALIALGHPALFATPAAALGLAGIAAVLSGLPFWQSAVSKERFAPLAFRPWFVAGAVGSAAIAVRLVSLALRDLTLGHAYFGFLAALLAAMLFAQATAVARMRGWGVLLATATGAACVVPAAVLRGSDATLLTLATLVSACLVIPVLAARRRALQPARVRLDVPAERVRLEAEAELEADVEWRYPQARSLRVE